MSTGSAVREQSFSPEPGHTSPSIPGPSQQRTKRGGLDGCFFGTCTGVCLESSSTSTIGIAAGIAPGQFVCNCFKGFTGDDCQTDINECDSSPCIHGTCSESNIRGRSTCDGETHVPGWDEQSCANSKGTCADATPAVSGETSKALCDAAATPGAFTSSGPVFVDVEPDSPRSTSTVKGSFPNAQLTTR